MQSLIIDIILLIFPILFYFVYSINSKALEKKVNDTFLEVAFFSSIYLVLSIGEIDSLVLILLNAILLLSYYKKREICSIAISIIILIVYSIVINSNLFLIFLIYSTYYLIYVLSKYDIVNNKLLNYLIVIISSLLFIVISYDKYDLGYIFQTIIFFSAFCLFLIKLIDKLNEVTILYKSVKDLENDKQIASSLFKITHEIKNPLAVCKGYLDMYDVNNVEHSRNYIPIIKEEIERTLILLGDFLSMSKVTINIDIIDINMLLEQIVENYSSLFKEKNIKTNIEIGDDELYIKGDYNRLVQVFVNIIKNSVEAIESNGYIEILAKDCKDYIEIIIKDNGIGIEKSNLEKIKEPFFTTKYQGTGLGIPLSIEIIKKHNGNIIYDSVENEGTKVIITLPIEQI